jgi:hypothetical protein
MQSFSMLPYCLRLLLYIAHRQQQQQQKAYLHEGPRYFYEQLIAWLLAVALSPAYCFFGLLFI